MNLEKLVPLIKQKDEQAFETIYQETKQAVYATIIAIIRDKDAALDVMQDTYIEMVSSINKYNPNYKFKSWIVVIARNKAIDYYRRKKKETSHEESDLDYLVSNENDFETEQEINTDALLKVLDDQEREIVLLHIVDDMKFREIAVIVQKSINTVLWVYNKAMKKMKKEYGGNYEK